MTDKNKSVIIYKHEINISGCSAVGDVCERTRWVIKRAIRSGSNLPIGELQSNEDRGLVTTGSVADNCEK